MGAGCVRPARRRCPWPLHSQRVRSPGKGLGITVGKSIRSERGPRPTLLQASPRPCRAAQVVKALVPRVASLWAGWLQARVQLCWALEEGMGWDLWQVPL